MIPTITWRRSTTSSPSTTWPWSTWSWILAHVASCAFMPYPAYRATHPPSVSDYARFFNGMQAILWATMLLVFVLSGVDDLSSIYFAPNWFGIFENGESLNRPRCSHAYKSTPQATLTLLRVAVFGEGWSKQVAFGAIILVALIVIIAVLVSRSQLPSIVFWR